MTHDIEKPNPFLIDEDHARLWDEIKLEVLAEYPGMDRTDLIREIMNRIREESTPENPFN